MRKIYIPFAYAKNIFDIEPSFYKKLGVDIVLVDLDNTLDSYKSYEPSLESSKLKHELEKNGIEVVIISNNRGKRVSTYANHLGTKYLANSGKPFTRKIRNYLKKNHYSLDKTILIGDQIMTDVKCGNKIGLRVILTDKLVPEDQWTTHFNRFFGRIVRKKLMKRNLLRNWRTIYEHD